jgi:cell division septation protein DedD
MEGKNILLVVICVCAFLVIVFGVALWFTLPKNGRDQGKVETKTDNGDYNIFTFVKNGEEAPGLVKKEGETSDGSMSSDGSTLVVGERPEGTSAPSGVPNPEGMSEPGFADTTVTETSPAAQSGGEDMVTLRVPLADKKAETAASAEKKSAYESSHRTETRREDTREAKRASATPRPKAAPAQKKRSSTTVEYWIQAGSYSMKSLAETQKDRLADHGFAAQLITRELSGKTYFRVRIGPYSNKAEAEKFLAWIRVIDGLEDSYISQISTRRNVN